MITPEEKQRIYEEEKARIEAREQLASEAEAAESRRRTRRWSWLWWPLGAVFVVMSIQAGVKAFNDSLSPSVGSAATDTVGVDGRGLSAADRAFLEKSKEYIAYMMQRGLDLGHATQQLQGGGLTLSELKQKFSGAQAMGVSARNIIEGDVPQKCGRLNELMAQNSSRFLAGCDEVMQYWKDGRTDHIASGMDAINASAYILTQANNERLRLLGEKSPKKG